MNIKSRVARQLAHALLVGTAHRAEATYRCAHMLGDNPAWLRPMVMAVSRRFANAWHSGSIEAITKSILDHSGFQSAWLAEHIPCIHRPVLHALPMAPRPWMLESCALPDLRAIGDVADWLDEPFDRLPWLAQIGFRSRPDDGEALRHYVYRWIEKRRGGHRLLEVPKPRLRAIQRRILHDLLEYVPPHEAAHGFRRGHSCLGNAAVHVGKKIVIHFDLKDFFLHVGGARVHGLFRTLGYSEDIARLLAGLCANRASARILDALKMAGQGLDWEYEKRYLSLHLPQGAPTSPYLANLCAFRLDVRLQGLAEYYGGAYTRYADDIVLSGDADMARAAGKLIPLVGSIALQEGFALNYKKTRIMKQSDRQVVTGIVVNQRPNIVRADWDALKATLFNCVRYGAVSQNRDSHDDYRAHLLGRIMQARHVHSARGQRLLEMFRRIHWE